MEDWIVFALFIVFILIWGICLVIAINGMTNAAIDRKMKKKFLTSLTNIIETYYNTDDYEECIFEINIIFKDIISKNSTLSRTYTNIPILLEKYISHINSETVSIPKDKKDSYKQKIKKLLQEYNKRNPLEQLKGIEFTILKELTNCLEHGKVEAGKEIINQLAAELKELKDANFEKDRNNKKQDFATKIGFILSIVFGIMTFIQFFV